MTLNKNQIQEILPHRKPFLFVDKVVNFIPQKSIEGEFFLDGSLPFFEGHFPNRPIMPGVLTCEALAQTSGILIALGADTQSKGKIFYLASSNIKYLSVAKAGDTLKLSSVLLKNFQGLFQFSVEAFAGKTPVAKGSLVLAAEENVGK